MAAQFIGLTVLLTLNDPGRSRLRGLVAGVNGPELTLRDVLFVDANFGMASYTVNGLNIDDIEIVPAEQKSPVPPPPPSPPPLGSAALPHISLRPPAGLPPPSHAQNNGFSRPTTAVNSPQLPTPSAQFLDPAIVSISQKPQPGPPKPPSIRQKTRQPSFSTPTKSPNAPTLTRIGSSQGGPAAPADATPTLISLNPTGAATDAAKSTGLGHPVPARAATSASTLQVPFNSTLPRGDAAGESSAFDETDDAASTAAMPPTPLVRPSFSGKRSRRGKTHPDVGGGQRGSLGPNPQKAPILKSVVVSPGMFGGPVAQAANSSATGLLQPGITTEKMRKHRRRRRRNDGNSNAEEEGWATEDVNDYKEREFDFQGNLDRFDKKSVFSQIKAGDATADEERLVSFNRLPQRGSNSKVLGVPRKNYHHHENVLPTYSNGQSLVDREGWPAPEFIAEESSEDSNNELLRGRGDGAAVDSGRSSRRAMSRQSQSHRRESIRQMGAPNPAMRSSENVHHHQSSSGGGHGPVTAGKPGKATLRLAPSGRPCPTVSPLQMLSVEGIAEVELCLSDEMMTENAGRGIAQVAIQAFGKRISASNHNAPPVVLVFAGNHKSGARAIAAGRHLKNHHVRVILCVLGLEREDELLEHVRRQLNVFRNAGGEVSRSEELVRDLNSLDSPPELIIDGLLGMYLNFEDLRTDQRATASELVRFANTSKASVLAVDVPSGVDGSTGEVPRLDNNGYLHMIAKWVVCMGAPKSGVLNALISGLGAGWNVYVADIGISNTAWRKYGTRWRHGVEFAAEWVVELQFHAAPPSSQ